MNQAAPRHFLDDLDDIDIGAAPGRLDNDEIKKNAHVANGGEAQFPCPKCGGSGQTRWGPCFKCNGRGQVRKAVAAAAKGKATKAENQLKWRDENKAAITYAHKRADKGNHFYQGMIEKLNAYGTWTENQLALVLKDIDKDSEFWAKKKAEQDAARPDVPTAALEALFNRPEVQKLAKTPIFRTVDITIKKAPANGQNPGALYVNDTETKEYLGKIVNGKWTAKWGTKDVTEALQRVAADPTEEAIKYATEFKACCCCGKKLVAPISVLAVVGPICGPRWGLDHLRMEAAALLAAEKEAQK
jgi:hypothetical protein